MPFAERSGQCQIGTYFQTKQFICVIFAKFQVI